MTTYYRIRATSMSVFHGYVSSDDLPHIFDEDGNFKGEYTIYKDGEEKVQNPDFDLYDQSFPYGIKPVNEDFEFTDYYKISEEEFASGTAEQERLV